MQLREFFSKNKHNELILSGVRMEKLSEGRRHHFTETAIEKYESRGLATRTEKKITLHTVDGDMVFYIDHPPTRVCLLCGEHLPNEDREKGGKFIPQGDPRLGAGARKHMAAKHKGEKSPNPQHPSGYKYKKYWGVTPDDSVPDINPKAKPSMLIKTKDGLKAVAKVGA